MLPGTQRVVGSSPQRASEPPCGSTYQVTVRPVNGPWKARWPLLLDLRRAGGHERRVPREIVGGQRQSVDQNALITNASDDGRRELPNGSRGQVGGKGDSFLGVLAIDCRAGTADGTDGVLRLLAGVVAEHDPLRLEAKPAPRLDAKFHCSAELNAEQAVPGHHVDRVVGAGRRRRK